MDSQGNRGERTAGSALYAKEINWYWLGAAALTLGVRFFLFYSYYTIDNDGVLYIGAARQFWEGQWQEGLASFYPPLYPLMISVLYPLVGDWELAGLLWPFVLGVATLFPLFGLFRRLYGPRIAGIALVLYALSPYLARLSVEVRSEMPYIFFLVLALYLLQRGLDGGGLASFFFAGANSALAYLIRPEGLGLVLVGALFVLYQRKGLGRLERGWAELGALVFGLVLFSAPYVLYLKWDTGTWMISRKTSFIITLGMAKHDPGIEEVTAEESAQFGIVRWIAARPLVYGRKVLIDAFRSLGFYFLALHFSYLPFLLLGWIFYFRGRFWTKPDFFLIWLILFYLAGFSLLYVTRRYGVPLAAVSLGWVGVGFLTLQDFARHKWEKRGWLAAGVVWVIFLGGTLPKTLQPIGRDKFYLREAGVYLRGRPGHPTIITDNGRVAFYAGGQNRIIWRDPPDFPGLLASANGDYLALDKVYYGPAESSLKQHGWLLDREFSGGDGESFFVLRRPGIS